MNLISKQIISSNILDTYARMPNVCCGLVDSNRNTQV